MQTKKGNGFYVAKAAKKSYCNARGNGRKLPEKVSTEEKNSIFNFRDVPGYSDVNDTRQEH